MKKVCLFAFAALTVALFSFRFVLHNYQIPARATAAFTIDGPLGVDVNGTLSFSNAAIRFDEAAPETSSMHVVLSVASMKTGIKKRDQHLLGADFFDVAKYPSITFKSTGIAKNGTGYVANGNLTIKDVTKAVSIPFTYVPGTKAAAFKGSFKIKRLDYNVGVGKTTGVGNQVTINLDIPVVSG